jgi:DNA adenine methylase
MIQRPFLKWAGGKTKIAARLMSALPKAQVLVEPFVGAGGIFLNSDFEHYVLSDVNSDLINTFNQLKSAPNAFIAGVTDLFIPENNNRDQYESFRERFNTTQDLYEKALLFVYLNRHCFNGLCRYNGSGGFNVSFGKYKAPYVPVAEMQAFASRLARAELHCRGFETAFECVPDNSVVYCDPPYVKLSKTANFTAYSAGGFGPAEQAKLTELAMACKVPVAISNHDTPGTRALYHAATLKSFSVQRNISQDGKNRIKAKELVAVFTPIRSAA